MLYNLIPLCLSIGLISHEPVDKQIIDSMVNVDCVMQRSSSPNWKKDKRWKQQLRHWFYEGKYDNLHYLIEQHKLPLDIKMEGKSFINFAIQPGFGNSGHPPFIRYLIEKGIDLNVCDKKNTKYDGGTALHCAMNPSVSVKVLETVLKEGFMTIDKHIRNNDERTPLDVLNHEIKLIKNSSIAKEDWRYAQGEQRLVICHDKMKILLNSKVFTEIVAKRHGYFIDKLKKNIKYRDIIFS